MVTDGTDGGAPPTGDLPDEAAFLTARREQDFISCARALLGMTAYVPLSPAQEFLVTTRGGVRYLRTYSSVERLVAGGYDPDQLLERDFSELLRRWNSGEIGVVVNPEDESEFRIPADSIPQVVGLPPLEADGESEPTPVVPVTPPAEVNGFRFAATVDGIGDGGRPVLAPERGRIDDPGERQLIRAYLNGGVALRVVTGYVSDLFEPQRGPVVPAHTVTDGRWIWSAGVGYYLDTYGIAPEPELLAVIRAADYTCPPVSDDALREAAVALEERDRISQDLVAEWRSRQ